MEQYFWIGVVESRQDPLKLGRCKVRIVGLHTEDKSVLPTDKLPWAMPVQSINSAGISGKGFSPTGIVEGSVVKIEFADPDQQQPFIIGTIGGIPQNPGRIDVADNDTIFIKDVDGELPEEQTQQLETSDIVLKPAKSYTEITDRLLDFIKEEEQLRLEAYQDFGGVWTIGYGTTLIDGKPVPPGLRITEEQANQLLIDGINSDAADAVRKNTKCLITQSMFDALVSLVYNIGRGNYFKSTLRTELNGSRYLECAARFSDFNQDNGVVLAGLVTRRQRERALFLLDGIPNETGTVIKNTIVAVGEPSTNGVSPGISENNLGFKDPKGVYPLYRNEPDTNRLARHEQIASTIVRKKEVSREVDVPCFGTIKWSQPRIPYNTQYPHNNVYESESGHVFEFDDTKNSERIHLYHKTGTFTEIDANGTQVNRIVGDGYEILERNGYVHINGSSNVTIDGTGNVLIGGNYNVDISGSCVVNIFNDAAVNVSGSMNVSVAEDFNVKAKNINLESENFNSFSSGTTNIESSAEMNIKAGGNMAVDTPRMDLNDNKAGSATRTGLTAPDDKRTVESVSFSDLSVITRGTESAANYETPEDGDFTEFQEYQLDKGLIEPEDIVPGQDVETIAAPDTSMEPLSTNCDIIFGMDSFQPSLQISKYFTLGALTKDGTRPPVNQLGLTKQEIVCNLKQLSMNCLDIVYEKYPNMIITSGFRRPGDVPKSSAKSDHYFGFAADITFSGFTRQQHYEAIKEIQQMIPYNQLLLEYSGKNTVWIHISCKTAGNKKQIFTMENHRRVSNFGEFKLIV